MNIISPLPAGYSITPNGFPVVAPGTLPFMQRFTFDVCPIGSSGNNCVNVIYDASVRGGVRPISETIIVLPNRTICNGPNNIFDNDTIENCTNGTSIPANATNTTLTVLVSSPFITIQPSGIIQLNGTLPLYTNVFTTYQLCNNSLAGNCRTATVSVRSVASCSVYKSSNNSLKDVELLDKEIILNPNPSNGIFNLYFNNSTQKEISVTIYNYLGQEILENNTNSNDMILDLSAYSNGNYLVKISDGDQIITKKIIKQ